MKITALITAVAASVMILAARPFDGMDHRNTGTQPIDRIIGNGEFNAVYPLAPSNDPESFNKQYVARVTKVVELLGSRDVSDMPQALREERARSLKRLLEYRDRGIFPVNYDHPGTFLPCFIDRNGAICAAGYLIEQSAGREFAEEINREYKYATIHQMNSPKLERWIASSGFTKAEIATIQAPAVGGSDNDGSPDFQGFTELGSVNSEGSANGFAIRGGRSVGPALPDPAPVPVESTPAVEQSAPAPAPAVEATIGMVQNDRDDRRGISLVR